MAQTKIVSGYPALMVEGDKKSLVITDLHLGFESKLSLNNVFLGKNKTVNEITKEIEHIISKTKPDSLILLGDVKSGIKSITKTEWDTVPVFFENMSNMTAFILARKIEDVIENFEPRVRLISVRADPNLDRNEYEVTIEFFVVNTPTELVDLTVFLEVLR
mgnify:CR=1 FL=1